MHDIHTCKHSYIRTCMHSSQVLFNMTSNVSAGPLIFDQFANQLFFVDNHPSSPFLGIADVSNGSYRIFLHLTSKVYGLAADHHLWRRKVIAYID